MARGDCACIRSSRIICVSGTVVLGTDILDAEAEDEAIPDDEYKKAKRFRKRILDVSQDLTYGVNNDRDW